MNVTDVTEIITAVSEPFQKLMDTISCALGKIYEPHHIKKMADARAYEIEKISNSIRDNCDLPLKYDGLNEYLKIDATDANALIENCNARLKFQEIRKEANIEAVISAAYDEISQEESVSDEEVDKDWATRFFRIVEDINDEDMQKIWGKILAGEIKEPKTFSLRTLEIIRNLSKSDALLFVKVCPIIFGTFIPNDDELLKEHELCYGDILNLDEFGLVYSSGILSNNYDITKEMKLIIDANEYIVFAKLKDSAQNDSYKIKMSIFPVSISGRALKKITTITVDFDSLKKYVKKLAQANSQIEFSIHKVNLRVNNEISYQSDNLLNEL